MFKCFIFHFINENYINIDRVFWNMNVRLFFTVTHQEQWKVKFKVVDIIILLWCCLLLWMQFSNSSNGSVQQFILVKMTVIEIYIFFMSINCISSLIIFWKNNDLQERKRKKCIYFCQIYLWFDTFWNSCLRRFSIFI